MNLIEYQHDWDKLNLGDIININYPNFKFINHDISTPLDLSKFDETRWLAMF